jgi:hypothetical protein
MQHRGVFLYAVRNRTLAYAHVRAVTRRCSYATGVRETVMRAS